MAADVTPVISDKKTLHFDLTWVLFYSTSQIHTPNQGQETNEVNKNVYTSTTYKYNYCLQVQNKLYLVQSGLLCHSKILKCLLLELLQCVKYCFNASNILVFKIKLSFIFLT